MVMRKRIKVVACSTRGVPDTEVSHSGHKERGIPRLEDNFFFLI